MRSRIFSTVAAVAAGVALTAGAAGVVGSALGGGSDSSSTTQQAAKIMVIKVPGSPATVIGTPGGN
ncbi:hypothetical protein ACQPZX_14430 [Actinoplanes sp. CA-142083]|uniref:hypothetical protein n=1 Tax=Actinoplanes sp. CA-142083 TaxID=3239903 RepID=UPI003D8E63C3